MDFKQKLSPADTPVEYIPWFKFPGRKTAKTPVAFGHWSTLGPVTDVPNVFPLDTACLWGGALTARRLGRHRETFSVKAPIYRIPGEKRNL